jgi:hypothetical protein
MRFVIDWIVQAQQPFSVIESSTFRALLNYCNPHIIEVRLSALAALASSSHS